jgi:transposase
MEALYLKSLNVPHHLICRICRIGEPTRVRYFRLFEQGGLDGLKPMGYKGRPNGLKAHETSWEEHFRRHLPHPCAQAQEEIEKLTGVRRGLTQARMFLRGLKMNYRKTGFVPGKADTPEKHAEQEDLLKKTSHRSWPKRKPESGWSFS